MRKAAGKDGVAAAVSSLEVGGNGGFEFFDHREAALDFSDDALLFGWWRHRH